MFRGLLDFRYFVFKKKERTNKKNTRMIPKEEGEEKEF